MDRNILRMARLMELLSVALRKESVDRNTSIVYHTYTYLVALRKESVDRNFELLLNYVKEVRRSPQGERG